MARAKKPPLAETGWDNNLDLTLQLVPPDQLLAHAYNARRHPGVQRDALRDAMGHIGWIAPVIANTTTGNLIDGHARVEEALSKGAAVVPVAYVTLTIEQELATLATFDPIGALATYDPGVLTILRGELVALPDTLTALVDDLAVMWAEAGTTRVEFDAALGGRGDAPDTDEPGGALLDLFDVAVVDPTTKVHDGDVWHIGLSVLIVADVMTGWDVWAPHLTDGSLFVPYPGPTVLMSGKLATRRLVMVQPVHYIAAGMVDRALAMFPKKVKKA